MQKSKIEWTDYTINPVKGLCPMSCSYCYARRMYKRFKWNPEIRFEALGMAHEIALLKQPSRIFVGSTMELFGNWIKPLWIQTILDVANLYKSLTFIFLTKQPHNLIKYSPFPDNCWVGVSTTGNDCRSGLEDIFKDIQAKVKFVSIEPLLDYTPMDFRWVDWIIVGQQTPQNKKTTPRIEWLKDIVERADKEHKPIFLKNNLLPSLKTNGGFNYNYFWKDKRDSNGFEELHCELRQEFPCHK